MQLPSKNSPPQLRPKHLPPFLKIWSKAHSPSSRYADNTSMKISNTPFFKTTLLYQLHPFLEKSESLLFQKFWNLNLPPLLRRGWGATMIHLCQLPLIMICQNTL